MNFLKKLINSTFDEIKKNNRAKNIKALETDPELKKAESNYDKAYDEFMEQAERRKKLIAEEEKKIAEKEDKRKKHINKEYEGEIAEKLLKKELFIDMTKQMLIDAWGEPDDKKETVFKNKVKLKYLYGKTSTSRGTTKYKTQVNLENDLVVGWKDV